MEERSNTASVPAFLAKLWRLVEDEDTNNLIYWNSDGRSFIIQNQAQFARDILPLNYKHNNMASFIRQLNMYGFHKITSLDNGGLKFDRDEMEFCHPCFVRGQPYMLENIKRKIAHARTNVPDEKALAPATPAVKPETLTRVLTEVKVMRGKQEVLDNRFSAMKQENEALWREVVMLRQKHMKQQQIVNKLIQFLVTIVQPSGRGNMGMKRRLPLMINDTPTAAKGRKTSREDYGVEIHSLADSEFEDDDDYVDLMTMAKPIVVQSKLVAASAAPRGMISELPNTPSSTRSQQDELEDIDEIIEEEAPEEDVNKIFEELNEATNAREAEKRQREERLATKRAKKEVANGKVAGEGGGGKVAEPTQSDDLDSIDPNEFLKFDNVAGTSAGRNEPANNDGQATVAPATATGPVKTWYANKDGFISEEIPSDLFDDQSQPGRTAAGGESASGLSDANFNPTLSEDLMSKLEEEKTKGKKKFNGKHLQLARLPSNSGDVFSLATPEDLSLHLDNVQSDLHTLKGLLVNDQYTFDPNQLMGQTGIGSSAGGGGSMGFNPNVSLPQFEMFDESNVLIPYQLSADSLGLTNDSGAGGSGKGGAEKQLIEYNPSLDLSQLLEEESSLDGGDRNFMGPIGGTSSTLNTPQPQ